MLRTIECSGFKSFVNFRLDFKPGLNILVGPNGSGKTNIILFLELLGSLTRSALIEAISRAGGAGSIFRRKLDGTLSDLIDFTISGHGPTSTYRNEGIKNVNTNIPQAYTYLQKKTQFSSRINICRSQYFPKIYQ
jgi:recombinational DNA repair ATPase RecF